MEYVNAQNSLELKGWGNLTLFLEMNIKMLLNLL
jgi:hypothetical protein